MAYTLRGRLDSRLLASLAPLVVACVLALGLRVWWPVELAAIMIAVGVALDLGVYHRLIAYQPAWAALPLGFLELGIVMGLAIPLNVDAPLRPALAFYWGSWLLTQALGHAVLPLTRLSYGDDGGQLGRVGPAVAVTALVVLGVAAGVAWATQPPVVRLAAGVHDGPLVIDTPQRLIGEPGAVVRGGIVVAADDVTVRDVAVLGGEYGIEVDGADRVLLERVSVLGATLDGINVRRSSVTIRDCAVSEPTGTHAQGIDVSFGFDLDPSTIEGCTVSGGMEGIVTHFAHVRVRDNRVSDTSLRGITLTEMSMGERRGERGRERARRRHLLRRLLRVQHRAELGGGDEARPGLRRSYPHGLRHRLALGAHAELDRNRLEENAQPVGSFLSATVEAG